MSSGLVAGVIASLGVASAAVADPILECGLMTEGQGSLLDCLNGQLEVTYGAMNEAMAMARAAAQEIDRVSGGDAAVLGVEASQHAWEAYRDTKCRADGILAGGGLEADGVRLACEIELTRERIDTLLRLAERGSG